MKDSQTTSIFVYLSSGKSLTALEALNLFGCFRLAARINDLRSEGYNIKTEIIATKNNKRVAEYKLIPQ